MSSPYEPLDDGNPPPATVGKLPNGNTAYSPTSTAGVRVGHLPNTNRHGVAVTFRDIALPTKSR